MSEQRDKIEIIMDILNACTDNHGLIKTHVVHTTNLNDQRASQYLQSMISQGLIRKEDNSYIVTEKGEDLRKGLDNLSKQLQLT